ncbi:MAG: glycosyltransferase [Clostridia bacterium]|nr:glycosyltransferase [Clostridia bacterium]
MIVKDEEKVLERCLKSAKFFVDEIIIVDTGSKDKTKKIAKRYTDKIYDFKWVDDFSKARNFAFSKATMDFIIWLDADDVIEESKKKFLELKNSLTKNIDVVMLKYNISFDEENNPIFSYYRERIVKNDRRFFWIDPVHEFMLIHGNIEYSNLSVSHRKAQNSFSKRNLKIYEKMLKNKVKLTSRQKFYYSRELMYNKFYKTSIKSFNDFLENYNGWIENKIEACSNLAFCYESLGDKKNALFSLFRSFMFDEPRAENLCKIGDVFFSEDKFKQAIYWYELATKCTINLKSGAFVLNDYYKYIPYLQLCVCYFKLNDMKTAEEFNNLALKIKPHSKEALQNKAFFENGKN